MKEQKSIQKIGRVIGKAAAILVVGACLGMFILTVAFMIPVEREHLRLSEEVLEREGYYPAVPTNSEEQPDDVNGYVGSFLPGVLDNFTDRLMINISTQEVKEQYLYHAMNMYCSFRDFNYSRYWHGYVAVVRPLLLFLDYSEMRALNGICQIGLILVLAYLIGEKKGFRYVCALLTSYALLMPIAVSLSFQYSWVFFIGVLGAIFITWKTEWCLENNRMLYVFMVLGMLTSFMDLLTYPLFTWGFPMVWWLAVSKGGQTEIPAEIQVISGKQKVYSGIKSRIQKCNSLYPVILSALFWVFGYGGMWAMKWILGSIVLGRNLISEAMGNVLGWSGIISTYEGGLSRRIGAITTNWKHYGYHVYELILLAWVLYFSIRFIRNGGKKNTKAGAYLLTAISSLVWFFMIDNHTIEHHFFAYRNFNVMILALIVFGLEILGDRRRKSRDELPKQEKMEKK